MTSKAGAPQLNGRFARRDDADRVESSVAKQSYYNCNIKQHHVYWIDWYHWWHRLG